MQSVDLTNLREMTDGDTELERNLFAEFMRSFEDCLTKLQASVDEAGQEVWRSNAHAMKGISYNLGATPLGDLCKKAQEEHQSPTSTKDSLLNSIMVEYEKVKDFLTKI
ncbi:MAG: Hpt domain-containing protein [Rickettsiales bacterium]